ncbi:MAG: NAD-dependent DNA ligase LigA [Candidatus Abawacabacteria bacterium]|nr:NAD-dependent DNA ligase LigA [Candidatus Abawacabacteria bacterium]
MLSYVEAKARIEKLKELINKWNYHYFTKDEVIFSEAARDDLKQELIILENSYPDLITPDSPSQKIGSILSGRLPKLPHLSRKWSLSDIFSFEELQDWEERLQKLLPGKTWQYLCELKIDGLNISLHYEGGKLTRGLTRGNGIIGEDITHSIKTIYGVPLVLNKPLTIEVSGEVYMPRKSLEKLNARLTREGKELFANPRSAAAGSVRQLDPAIAAERDLGMFVYTLGQNDLANAPETQEESLAFLASLGFMISPHIALADNLAEVQQFYKKVEAIRDNLAFDIDGIVVKVNDKTLQEQAGFTAKTPRAQVAYKFPATEASTVIEGITIQIGRTGALTPVAELRAVDLAGSTVKRATLHNKKEIERKDIRIGDTVIIHKAGDVIPEILHVLPELRTGREKVFVFPTICPICHSITIEENEGTVVRCSNKQCFAQHREQMIHATAKKAFDIDGMGESVIDELIALDLCGDIGDVFLLTEKDLAQIPLFKEKKVKNLIKAIEIAKNISFPRLLFALGIRHIGEETARDLAKFAAQKVAREIVAEFEAVYPQDTLHPLLEYLMTVSAEELLVVNGFGPEVTSSIVEWFAAKESHTLLKKLAHVGVKPQALVLYENGKQTFFTGKSFVITGTLASMSRDQAKELILKSGGHVQSAVSRSTNYLICGEEAGSKLKKAQTLGVTILAENQFTEKLSAETNKKLNS